MTAEDGVRGSRKGAVLSHRGCRRRFLLWVGTRAVFFGLIYLFDAIRQATTGTALLSTGLGASFGFGILLVIPAVTVGSLIAWSVSCAAVSEPRGVSRPILLLIGVALEMFCNTVGLVSAVPGDATWVVIALILACGLTAIHVAAFVQRHRN